MQIPVRITSITLACLGLTAAAIGGCASRPGAPCVDKQNIHVRTPAAGAVLVAVAPSPDDTLISAIQYEHPLLASLVASGSFADGIGSGGSTIHVAITSVSEKVGTWSSTGHLVTTWTVTKADTRQVREFSADENASCFANWNARRAAIEQSAGTTIRNGLTWVATLP